MENNYEIIKEQIIKCKMVCVIVAGTMIWVKISKKEANYLNEKVNGNLNHDIKYGVLYLDGIE